LPTTSGTIQFDPQGNVYVAGHSNGAFQRVNAGRPGLISGGFVSEIDPTGSSLLFSTVVGAAAGPAVNTGNSSLTGLAVDTLGNVYVTGSINDATLPTTAAVVQPSFAGGSGAFGDGLIAKINLAPSITSSGVGPVHSRAKTIQPGEWPSIYGTGLASSTTVWTGSYPISLGGTSVTINGSSAYLSLVSPTQINFQAPSDTTIGSVPVVVKTANGTATSTVTLAQLAPSLLFLDSKHLAGIIVRSDGSGAYGGGAYDIIGPTRIVARLSHGCGQSGRFDSALRHRVWADESGSDSGPGVFGCRVNGQPGDDGLSGAGLDQIYLIVLAGLGTGDVGIVVSVGGVSTQPNAVISVQ
jgi:hypothetical protein